MCVKETSTTEKRFERKTKFILVDNTHGRQKIGGGNGKTKWKCDFYKYLRFFKSFH